MLTYQCRRVPHTCSFSLAAFSTWRTYPMHRQPWHLKPVLHFADRIFPLCRGFPCPKQVLRTEFWASWVMVHAYQALWWCQCCWPKGHTASMRIQIILHHPLHNPYHTMLQWPLGMLVFPLYQGLTNHQSYWTQPCQLVFCTWLSSSPFKIIINV